jgi:N-acetylmuramoyl-L-alanine amidase
VLAAATASAGEAVLHVGDQEYRVAPVHHLGETVYLPGESLLEKLGGKAVWHAGGRRLTVRFGTQGATTTLFSSQVLAAQTVIELGAKPRFVAGRFMLPLSFYERVVPLLLAQPVRVEVTNATAPPAVVPRLFVDKAAGRHRMLSLKKVVLDAGHGGHDPGAKSPEGIREKRINLEITLALADALRRRTDVEVMLTRSDDTFLPLGKRTAMANASGADMFVCVHANGAYRRSATGFEVYFLSLTSSDQRAADLAALENGGEALPTGPGEGDDLNMILQDMIRTEHLAASERLAVAMQARLDLAMNLENRGVKQAPFYVLAGAQMPAVLVEVGFVTNPEEARLLIDPANQKRIVDALVEAILFYDAVNGLAE